MWFFPSVAGLVLQKLSVRVEWFSTLVTCECFVCRVSPLVLLEITQVVKSWAARQVQRIKHQSHTQQMCHNGWVCRRSSSRYCQSFVKVQFKNETIWQEVNIDGLSNSENHFCLEQSLTSTTYITQMWLLSCVDHFVTMDISWCSKAGKHRWIFISYATVGTMRAV